jgi:hypothetical protein
MSTIPHEDALELTKWGAKWIKFVWGRAVSGSSSTQIARTMIKEFDTIVEEPQDFVVQQTYTEEKCTQVGTSIPVFEKKTRTTHTLAKGHRSRFAMAVAKKAYNKFGRRPVSQANLLVTRKWIQKYMEEAFKDLRTADKNVAIDRALFLSFVPTLDYNRLAKLMENDVFTDRIDNKPESFWGKVFTLKRGGTQPK